MKWVIEWCIKYCKDCVDCCTGSLFDCRVIFIGVFQRARVALQLQLSLHPKYLSKFQFLPNNRKVTSFWIYIAFCAYDIMTLEHDIIDMWTGGKIIYLWAMFFWKRRHLMESVKRLPLVLRRGGWGIMCNIFRTANLLNSTVISL